jgi:hypothetical protein
MFIFHHSCVLLQLFYMQACQKRVGEDTTGEAHCTGQVCWDILASSFSRWMGLIIVDILCSTLIIGIVLTSVLTRNCLLC